MGEEIKEECGILGIYLKDISRNNPLLIELARDGLSAIQNRGQTGAGFVSYKLRAEGNHGRILDPNKTPGTVHRLFGSGDINEFKKICEDYAGIGFIGHVRYGTSGKRGDDEDYVQPFLRRHGKRWKKFGLSFNGNLANYSELEQELIGTEYDLETNVDTELIMHLFSLALNKFSEKFEDESKKPDFYEVAKYCSKKMDGAYNLLFLFGDGEMTAVRDPFGFKPLFYGENNLLYAVASETTALEKIGISKECINSFPRGGIMKIKKNCIPSLEKLIIPEFAAPCHFEATYFSDVGSKFEDIPIHTIRTNYGNELANDESPEILNEVFNNRNDWLVTYAPDSAFESASQFALRLGLPLRRGLKKSSSDDEPKRNFINSPEDRPHYMRVRYNLISEVFEGKNVFLIDDSVVRGDTLKNLVQLIKNVGKPNSLHIRITEPPITHPCFYGIDMSTFDQLIANKFSGLSSEELNKKMAEYFGVDSFRYQTLRGLDSAFGENFKGNLCKACINGEYPTPFGKKRAEEAMQNFLKKK